MSFWEFGLHEKIVHAVQRLRYIDPTPIQSQAIPTILQGCDVIGSAQTGTGKSAAFALPLLSRMGNHSHPRVLVLEPTRELAAQLLEAVQDFAHFTDLATCLLHGGVKIDPQTRQLKKGPDMIIATPGRLIDHVESGNIKLDTIETVVLDEADRMLDMGFWPDVTKIVRWCSQRKQTLLFSATIPPQIQYVIEWALKDPVTIAINRAVTAAETVDHALYPVANDQKMELLLALLEALHYDGVIVFSRTKMGADDIAATLDRNGHKVAVIHSDLTQAKRTQSLEDFKSRTCEVLVATDIASRGIDIANVTHVINYDVPENPEDYIHRIGRTGRATQSGDALTLITGFDVDAVRRIESLLNQEIPRRKLDGFAYKYTALLAPPAAAPRRRRR
jgi:ATP-dependent RNA helicase RhlE